MKKIFYHILKVILFPFFLLNEVSNENLNVPATLSVIGWIGSFVWTLKDKWPLGDMHEVFMYIVSSLILCVIVTVIIFVLYIVLSDILYTITYPLADLYITVKNELRRGKNVNINTKEKKIFKQEEALTDREVMAEIIAREKNIPIYNCKYIGPN
jgi:hypothetical protein